MIVICQYPVDEFIGEFTSNVYQAKQDEFMFIHVKDRELLGSSYFPEANLNQVIGIINGSTTK